MFSGLSLACTKINKLECCLVSNFLQHYTRFQPCEVSVLYSAGISEREIVGRSRERGPAPATNGVRLRGG